jgi:hypothetical protein
MMILTANSDLQIEITLCDENAYGYMCWLTHSSLLRIIFIALLTTLKKKHGVVSGGIKIIRNKPLLLKIIRNKLLWVSQHMIIMSLRKSTHNIVSRDTCH